MLPAEIFFSKALEKRKQHGSLRSLVIENSLIDFCSTDYLGLAKSVALKEKIVSEINVLPSYSYHTGSGGSRLMRGNYLRTEKLEEKIAAFHKAESALIYNSGYDANAGFFSCVAQRNDIILHDELIHVSSRDGMRLSLAKKFSFRHNDAAHLTQRIEKLNSIKQNSGSNLFVAVESVYSMDGDFAPLAEIASVCEKYHAHLIVDEAHATGVFGKKGEGRVVELGLEEKVFAVVHTFGKGLGCHGAAVLGSRLLRNFLINFSHSFIYSTAIPPLNIIALNAAYDLLEQSQETILHLNKLLFFFKKRIKDLPIPGIIPSESQIQCIVFTGNEQVKAIAKIIQQKGFDVRPVLSPSVPEGKERLRICLHAFNTEEEVRSLTNAIHGSLVG